MRQVPDITEGEYREMPGNVVQRYGEYYTDGTVPYTGYIDDSTRALDRAEEYFQDDSTEGDNESSGSAAGSEEGNEWVEKWIEKN